MLTVKVLDMKNISQSINFNADVNFLQEVVKNYDRPKNEDKECHKTDNNKTKNAKPKTR